MRAGENAWHMHEHVFMHMVPCISSKSWGCAIMCVRNIRVYHAQALHRGHCRAKSHLSTNHVHKVINVAEASLCIGHSTGAKCEICIPYHMKIMYVVDPCMCGNTLTGSMHACAACMGLIGSVLPHMAAWCQPSPLQAASKLIHWKLCPHAAPLCIPSG